MEEVTVEDLMGGLTEVETMMKRTKMRVEVVAKTRGKITQIISMIKTIEIIDEEEEGKELEEEASMENVPTATKKGIDHLNVLRTKEGIIEEMNGRVELLFLMKIQGHRNVKMMKEEKF